MGGGSRAMSLADRFAAVDLLPKCSVCRMLVVMSSEDREALLRALDGPISSAEITRILKDEGFPVLSGSVKRHRRKECLGYGPSEKP
jgi:hypothetical protein